MTVDVVVDKLTVGSPQGVILHELSFTLQAGESLTILGQTGAGKSLLVHALMGNLPAGLQYSGQLRVAGIDPLASPRQAQQRLWGKQVSMLPQEPWHALNPVLKIRDQLYEVWRWVRRQPRAVANSHTTRDLQELGLSDAGSHIPSQLSGGMAQRAAFAMANAAGGALMLADEPTKGLDASRRHTVIELLQRQQRRGSLLAITHDLEVAKALAGRLLVLKDGQVVEQGWADTVLAQPQHPYTRALLNAMPSQWPTQATPGKPGKALIKAENLTVYRGKSAILDDFSLNIDDAEIVGLSGDSGSGKSTLGDVLLGLLPYQHGYLTPPLAIGKQLKLYQDPPASFAAGVAIGKLLQELIDRHQLDAQQVTPLLKRLQLSPDLLQRPAEQVSGGELQRLALLRVMLMRPRFIVADEPTSRLDPITAKLITEQLVGYCREQECALLLISHDRQLLDKTCDRVLTIN